MLAVLLMAGSDLHASHQGYNARELEAVVTKLGDNVSAITYWVSGPDG